MAGFRKFGSVGVKHQPVMTIARRRQTQQFLQNPMDRGRQEKIASAHHIADALQRIVYGHRQMVARREFPPGKDDISPGRRLDDALDRVRPFAEFPPDDPGRRQLDRATHVEPERRPVASREARGAFAASKRTAGSRVERRAVGIARDGRARDLGPAAEAGIDDTERIEPRQRFRIIVWMLALAARRVFETKSEPGKIVENGSLVLRLAPRAVEVFYAQEQASAESFGGARVAKRGIGVPEVQRAIRRRRETKDGCGGESVGAHDGKAGA